MVFLSFGWEPVSFLFVEYLGMLEVFQWYFFHCGNHGFLLPCPCFWPRHRDLPFLPVHLWVEGS